ncbi:MAG TPA: translation initiation factor IF-2 [Geminicoccus sp.]|jgi:translation initiation factor IF-2|uniref:translation initiation factor IF-2 n=1 Tax=Geminicoccus sp. TaxID=2024832 RepID=UPI002E30A520|nr:translation initiation factor IF-2 [Geminicoccus sp.]HEX2526253.1 translation initiation factor IF-2 [Geminicoccus sp.]
MNDPKGQDTKARIGLNRPSGTGASTGRMDLPRKTVDVGTVKQARSHGVLSKPVQVEVRKSRAPGQPPAGVARMAPTEQADQSGRPPAPGGQRPSGAETRGPAGGAAGNRGPVRLRALTEAEHQARLQAVIINQRRTEEDRKRAEEEARQRAIEDERRRVEAEAEARRRTEEETRRKAEDEIRRKAEEQARRLLEEQERKTAVQPGAARPDEAQREAVVARQPEARAEPAARPAAEVRPAVEAPKVPQPTAKFGFESVDDKRGIKGKAAAKAPKLMAPAVRRDDSGKIKGRIVLGAEGDIEERKGPSVAAMRRRQQKGRQQIVQPTELIVREVAIPDVITVQDLAARMAVRSGEVIKVLMKNHILATPAQTIDADTAELVVSEFGHRPKRVSESLIEEGVEGLTIDEDVNLQPRSPVVTVMGHVDHGKTSLLDALRNADVAAHEAGGITQHIGAYRVDIGSGMPVTFIDTPGHAAFTQMRARGASVTDIVILVVAADDGVMPQTIEAIRHAQAAKVPIVVAINKIDRPEADPTRVKNELLSYDVVTEEFGGDVQAIEVSAIKRTGLENLIEAVQLQAELLDLKANPDREAQGTIIEARLDRGRGVVATALVQKGTLKVGDTVVCGVTAGRVRALVDDRGKSVTEAGPSVPVEILGLDGVPSAGDLLSATDNADRAREIAEYRQRKKREAQLVATAGARGSLEDMFSKIKVGELKELSVVIKTDVHGSLEAVSAGLQKLGTDEVSVRILHGGVGAITESDVTLAAASGGVILGFNVRANAPAREMAKRDGVEIRYYSIIYELLDEMKALLSGLLAPEAKEVILGHAEIREIFVVQRIGKIAGCRVIDGLMKRTARIRLLRDDVVIHEGALGSLKRFKDDVREVRDGFECGLSLEGYNDIRQGDVVEAYEVQEVARSL